MNNSIIIPWQEKYETGVDRIDFEHKIFLELLNSFKFAIDRTTNKHELTRLIIEIEKYAEFHFISEENFMQRIHYPELKDHRIEHFELLEKFNIAKNSNCNFDDFYSFLKEWFIQHTFEEDIKIKKYLIMNNIDITDSFYQIKI